MADNEKQRIELDAVYLVEKMKQEALSCSYLDKKVSVSQDYSEFSEFLCIPSAEALASRPSKGMSTVLCGSNDSSALLADPIYTRQEVDDVRAENFLRQWLS